MNTTTAIEKPVLDDTLGKLLVVGAYVDCIALQGVTFAPVRGTVRIVTTKYNSSALRFETYVSVTRASGQVTGFHLHNSHTMTVTPPVPSRVLRDSTGAEKVLLADFAGEGWYRLACGAYAYVERDFVLNELVINKVQSERPSFCVVK